MSRSHEWPIGVRPVDVAQPLEPLTGLRGYSRVRVFVSRGDRLVGSVDIWNRGADSISVSRLTDEIAGRLSQKLLEHDLRRRLDPQHSMMSAQLRPQTASIIVAACDRSQELRQLLASLVRQRTHHSFEIIVVDNRPSTGVASAVAHEFPSVRLVHEDRPGLSYARNAGIAHARGSIIVATDDDVVAPEDWIEKLLAPFGREEVMCVTGHVLPSELETEAQCRFEAYGGLGKGFEAVEADAAWFQGFRTAVPTWRLGATANAAFRRSIFSNPGVGPLEEALGAGTPAGCSEDTYLFYRILKSGGTIVYEPSAYVWHRHRESMSALRAQIYAYSKGQVAYQLLTLMREGDRRALMRLLYSLPRTYLRRTWGRLRRHSEYPISLIAIEVLGNLAGPWALWRSMRRVRQLGPGGRPALERSDVVPLEGQAT